MVVQDSAQFANVEVVRSTGQALLCLIGGKTVAVPPRLILAASEVRQLGDRGTLAIPKSLAISLGLVGDTKRPAELRFLVSCRHCQRPLMIVGRISDPELAQLQHHVRHGHPGERLGETPGVAATLWHFRVMPSDPEPPVAA